jgi:hypothetical protein
LASKKITICTAEQQEKRFIYRPGTVAGPRSFD